MVKAVDLAVTQGGVLVIAAQCRIQNKIAESLYFLEGMKNDNAEETL